ncbi:Spindle pole body protein pcp1 [Sphaceloma murrayae]|uniref:Spindle pole body protein pcp1 n=1 Tax=Sphaceloma murrayae TaxID=2082308 RepID=A0A2K1QPN8_9PEZI|nr:Spindle pole body protein pcp1 [Sphaceloma murrayae]
MSSRRHDYPTSRRDPNHDGPRQQHAKSDRYDYNSSPSSYAYPPPPSRPSTQRPSRPRRKWPPQPSVEEETSALRKEHRSRPAFSKEEVPSRGSIDQDPLLVQVQFPKETSRSNARGVPTPPTSDDDDRRKNLRRHGPKLETAAIPEMRRAPSPYSTSTSTSRVMPDSASTVPSATDRDGRFQQFRQASASSDKSGPFPSPSARSQDKSSAYPEPAARKLPQDSRPASATAIDDADLAEDETYLRRNERRSARYSFTKPVLSAEPEVLSERELPTRTSTTRRPLLSDDNRRHTDSWMEIPREQVVEGIRKPAPLKVASLVREASGQHSPASPNKLSGTPSSNRGSPRSSSNDGSVYPPSPPRSPRVSQDHYRDSSSATQKRSHQSSKEGSRDTSPQASPMFPIVMPILAGGFEGTSDQIPSRSVRLPTRLANATRPNEAPRPTARTVPPPRSESLPYPVDEVTATMPEERDHQYFPESLRPLQASTMFAKTMSRAGTPLVARPPLQKHQSYRDNTTAPTTPTSPMPARGTRHNAFAEHTPLTPPVTTPIMLPCQRADFVSGYDDWYTLDECPDFDICEPCLVANFQNHYHRAYFRPVRRNLGAKIRCDFSRQWLRLAWLLTLQRQVPNLSLLKAVYRRLEDRSTLPCPDIDIKPHSWFTVLDDETRTPLLDFHICQTDVDVIVLLLPILKGFFFPFPPPRGSRISASNLVPIDTSPRLCAFRTTNNNRFQIYLDSLISLHESAIQSSRHPDMIPFVQLVKHKLSLDECPRDNILQGAKWFFIPSLPDFTVCEDCHDDIIAPLLRQDKDLAMRFNRTRQSLPGPKDGRSARDSVASLTDVAREASCALYSNRMRQVFMAAVEGNDVKLLTRVARQRREMEKELQRKAQPVIARIGEVDEGIARWEDRGREGEREVRRFLEERARLEEKLRRYQREWAEWE